jgi:hypothetical protein
MFQGKNERLKIFTLLSLHCVFRGKKYDTVTCSHDNMQRYYVIILPFYHLLSQSQQRYHVIIAWLGNFKVRRDISLLQKIQKLNLIYLKIQESSHFYPLK